MHAVTVLSEYLMYLLLLAQTSPQPMTAAKLPCMIVFGAHLHPSKLPHEFWT